MHRLLAAALVALLAIGPSAALAGKPQPATFVGPFWLDTFETVEQQSIGGCCFGDPSVRVFNPDYALAGGCAWDADDQIWGRFVGGLDSGATVSGSVCLYADWSLHLVAFRVTSPGLVGTLTLPGHVSLTVPAGQVGCIAGPDYWFGQRGTTGTPLQVPDEWRYSPLLTEVVGSNGGVAVPVTFTVTLTNPTARRVRNVDAEVKLVLAGFELVALPTGCPFPMFNGGTKVYPVGHDPQVHWWVGP
jgi:hypothetical protein